MKNNPFPQAQMLDSQGVLHEWHGVHNPAGNPLVLDNLLKSIAIRPLRQLENRRRIQAPSGFCADLAQPPAAATSTASHTRHNRQNQPWHRINSALPATIDRNFSRQTAKFFVSAAIENVPCVFHSAAGGAVRSFARVVEACSDANCQTKGTNASGPALAAPPRVPALLRQDWV